MKNKTLLIGKAVCTVVILVVGVMPLSTKANGNCGFDTTLVQNMGQFSTPVSSATYQWLYCSTGLPINGANAQTYTPPFGGSYAVAITLNGCTDTTVCLQSQSIIATGIHEAKAELPLNVATISNGDFLTINNSGAGIDATIIVMNTIGQTVLQQQMHIATAQQLNTAGLQPGWYIVNITSGSKNFISRFFKNL